MSQRVVTTARPSKEEIKLILLDGEPRLENEKPLFAKAQLYYSAYGDNLRAKEASEFLGTSVANLAVMRSDKRGPDFSKPPGIGVRYDLVDLCTYWIDAKQRVHEAKAE